MSQPTDPDLNKGCAAAALTAPARAAHLAVLSAFAATRAPGPKSIGSVITPTVVQGCGRDLGESVESADERPEESADRRNRRQQ
jgi:hypothetical protein